LVTLTDIHRMTGFLTQDCCRTTALARASPPQERQQPPTNGNFATARMGSPKLPSSRRTSPEILAGTDGNRTHITHTPFNGEHNAGIQVLNTASFPDANGPLFSLK
jgi:hypothetical protein